MTTTKLKPWQLILLYIFFAILAIAANLLVQRIIIGAASSIIEDTKWLLMLAICGGTISGLVIKYILDKNWIFAYKYKSDISENFMRYSATGIITTFIFWSSELLFWFIWNTHFMREIGALCGLSMGYVLKFYLDKKFVFNNVFEKQQ